MKRLSFSAIADESDERSDRFDGFDGQDSDLAARVEHDAYVEAREALRISEERERSEAEAAAMYLDWPEERESWCCCQATYCWRCLEGKQEVERKFWAEL